MCEITMDQQQSNWCLFVPGVLQESSRVHLQLRTTIVAGFLLLPFLEDLKNLSSMFLFVFNSTRCCERWMKDTHRNAERIPPERHETNQLPLVCRRPHSVALRYLSRQGSEFGRRCRLGFPEVSPTLGWTTARRMSLLATYFVWRDLFELRVRSLYSGYSGSTPSSQMAVVNYVMTTNTHLCSHIHICLSLSCQ